MEIDAKLVDQITTTQISPLSQIPYIYVCVFVCVETYQELQNFQIKKNSYHY